jgi:putative ABC transport system substrate-binding protein
MVRALALFVLLIFMGSARSAVGTVLVLYPDAPPPYRQAFEQIIAGIEHAASGSLQSLALSPDYDIPSIERWLRSHGDDDTALVLLGQRALRAYEKLSTALPVFAGAINSIPGQVALPGVSVTIEPSLFLDFLRELSPSVKTVIAFHNTRNRGLISLMEKAAAERGLSIKPVAVGDAQTAVKAIGRIFDSVDPRTTVLWFTRNTININTELIFPFVLEQAWKRRIPVFSETLSHTKRGFLFSLYPDYFGMGMELASLIESTTRLPRQAISLTRAARFALNTRTARHLGIPLPKGITEKADVLFPAP